ncbi:ABC transporter permease [Chitinispirillum alkaliphilum]|nr:ABC transporter permease [Chitinispirillum alkaliphilum]
MSIQLFLVGLYLEVVFTTNHPLINFSWILIMILVANFNIRSNSGLKSKPLFLITFTGLSISTILIVAFFILFAVGPTPFYDARYLIPISGMILGNCLRGNIVGLERYTSQIRDREEEYINFLFMGATPFEASRPIFSTSVQSALAPTVSTMATMGLVSLPGMMTGQILGGASPGTAIRYQIGVMIAIFASTTLGVFINLFLCSRHLFDNFGFVKEVYRK